jgi:magnesium chelatase family protein
MFGMLSLAFSAAMLGIEGYVVRVEADSSAGSPYVAIIGLPDRALGEARERVRAAICNSGFAYPAGRLLVNLSPTDVRKTGPAFDLAIALALMGIDEQVHPRAFKRSSRWASSRSTAGFNPSAAFCRWCWARAMRVFQS